MAKPAILAPSASYSFSQYGAMLFDTADILVEFSVTLQSLALNFPQQSPIDPNSLKLELAETLALVDLTSEMARRESLIFPVLKTVCKQIKSPLQIAMVRTIFLRGMKKAAHRIECKCKSTIAPMDSFNRILSGLLETADHLANPIVSFC